MKGIIGLIVSIIFIGIAVLLCLFSCIISSRSDEYWNELKKELEKHNERR